MTTTPPNEADLHAKIMNIPCPAGIEEMPDQRRLDYKAGHRDARHAAAELAVQAASPAAAVPELTEDQASALDAAFARMREQRDALKRRLFEALDSDPILKEGLDEVDHALHINRMTYSRVLDVACAQKARADEAEAKLAALASATPPAQPESIHRKINRRNAEALLEELMAACELNGYERGLAAASQAPAPAEALTDAERLAAASQAELLAAAQEALIELRMVSPSRASPRLRAAIDASIRATKEGA